MCRLLSLVYPVECLGRGRLGVITRLSFFYQPTKYNLLVTITAILESLYFIN